MLIDTHCHLTHERYAEDLAEVLGRAEAAGVEGIVTVASDLEDALGAIRLARSHGGASGGGPGDSRGPWIRATAGVHPHQAAEAPPDTRIRLEALLDEHDEIVAIGECGLDFHYDFAPKSRQHEVLALQLELAAERDLPVVVHCREAEAEMIPVVREAGATGVTGVLHCYPGDLDLLETAMEADWLVSFTGLVTFSSYDGGEAVRRVPADRYMLETDGPYMAPVPHRGKRNEPAWVPHIRDRVAALRGETSDEIERASTATARRFFRL